MKSTLIAAAVMLISCVVWADSQPASRPAEPGKIVYLCQANGSMQEVYSSVRHRLKESIDQLTPQQSFNVIFYFDSDDAIAPFSKAGLVPANEENKKQVHDFVDD